MACPGTHSFQSVAQNSSSSEFFLISNFRHVLYVVCFLLANSPLSEFYMPILYGKVNLIVSVV